MGGSYKHIVDRDNKFKGIDGIDNLGDAYEALEECYDMIQYLTDGDKEIVFQAWWVGHLKRGKYSAKEIKEYWHEDDYEEDDYEEDE